MTFAGIAGAPLVWLAALQAGYVLAYQACDDRSSTWVLAPPLAALATTMAILGLAAFASRRARHRAAPAPLLARIGLATAALMLIVLAASAVAPFLLHPCA